MNSHDIEYVLTIARERSFSKASKKLFITQPSLSRSIISIEKELGCKLFDRSAKPLALTEAGELYVSAATRISEIEASFKESVRKKQEQETTPLRLGISPFRATYYLPMVLGVYHKRYPNSEIQIDQGPIAYLKEKLIRADLDLVVGPGPVQESNLEFEQLPDDYIYLALPPSDMGLKGSNSQIQTYNDILTGKAHKAKPIDFSQARDREFISYKNAMLDQYLRKKCKNSGFEPNIIFMINDFHTALDIVQGGFGCNLTFETVILASRYDRHPLYYRVNTTPWEVVAIWRKGSHRGFASDEFLSILKVKLQTRSIGV